MKKKGCALLLFILICLIQPVRATNITVGTISALQTALAGAADTIYLTAGAYAMTTALAITRTVTIIGLPGGGNEVVMKMTGTPRHFAISGTVQVKLNALVLVGPNADYSGGGFVPTGGTAVGGGCSVAAATNTLIITGCRIGGCNSGGAGGAVATTNANNTLQINGSLIEGNTGLTNGGGIYATGPLTLNNDTITNNKARAGGGIYNTMPLNLTNCRVINNAADITGGGIHTTAAISVIASTINSNTAGITRTGASNGGGIYSALTTITMTITNSTINNNRAWNSGGGIYASGPLILTNDTISQNKACYDPHPDSLKFRIPNTNSGTTGCGGGVFANNSLTLAGAILMEGDTTVVKGGGIYKGATGSLTADPDADTTGLGDNPDTLFATAALDTLIMNNCVTTGEAFARNGDPEGCFGGAIFAGTSVYIRKARFFHNSSGDSGAAIWGAGVSTAHITLENVVALEGKAGYNPFSKKYYADCSGGVVCTEGNIILSGDLLFERDTAANVGGALCAYRDVSTIYSSNLRSLTINGCAAIFSPEVTALGSYVPNYRGQGGAICANQDIVLEASNAINIINNTSYTHGGALYSVTKGIFVKGATISGNTARHHGGAMYAPGGSVVIDSCRLSGNRAGFDPFLQADSGAYNGGAVYASKELRLRGAIVMDSNSANNHGGAIAKVVGGKFIIADVTTLRLRSNRTTTGNGGAIYIEDSLSLSASTNLEIRGNKAGGNGGAIYSKNKPLSLREITIGNNQADTAGGAIWSGGELELIKVTLDSNRAATNGGAVYKAAPGKMDIRSSTFVDDTATNGGAVYTEVSTIANVNTIVNSSFSRNYVTGSGGALYSSATSAPIRIAFTTFNGNVSGPATGNALFLAGTANKVLRGNIIYGNGATGVEINQTAFPAASFNIVRNATLTGGTGNLNLAAGNGAAIFESMVAGDEAALANNGGLTQTIAIKRNGYAHNYVPTDTVAAWATQFGPITMDQRDSLRPAGCKFDVGSFELQEADDPASYSLKDDTICGNSFINADTLITATQFIVDTVYFKNSAFTDSLAMPLQVSTASNIYVKFITSSHCELYDTLAVTPLPLVDSITGNDVVAVNYTLPLQTATPGGTWSSSDPVIATVDQSGIVTGVNVGVVTITYTLAADTCTSMATQSIIVVAFPLSLKLTGFRGNRQSGNDHLTWITEQEINTSHFEVEWSTDGITFTKVGVVAAMNSSAQHIYSFTRTGASGKALYRLKMVDMDGRFTYSTVIRIGSAQDVAFKAAISPNPAKGTMNLVIEGVQAGEDLLFEIINSNGILIHCEHMTAGGNAMMIRIDRPAISSGLYFYRVRRSSNRETNSGKLVLQ